MKKIITAILITLALILPCSLFAAGSCVQTPIEFTAGGSVVIKFVCTGDSANGTIPTQTFTAANMSLILGTHYFYETKTYPTVGGTAPDAADIAVLMDGQDLLGGKGANLVHATATQDTMPYSTFMSSYRYPMVTNTITWTLASQATANANFTVEHIFSR